MNIKIDIKEGGETGTNRRSFLKYAGGLGAAVVGAIAGTWADAPRAAAASCYNVGCCGLATHIPCGGHWNNDGNFSCPSGYEKTYWGCVASSVVGYICWECYNGKAGKGCQAGPCGTKDYSCSNWYEYKMG
jgi:hypothetical protein